MTTAASLDARCLGTQRKDKAETLTLQITETHFPILE